MHGYKNGRYYYQWIGITHVCRHWRRVAFSTPRLWNHIVVNPEKPCAELLETLLLCSKQVPLALRIMVNAHCNESFVKAIQDSWLISDLDLKIWTGCHYANYFTKICTSLPLLRSLRLHHEPVIDSWNIPSAAPIPFLLNDTPLLEHLEFIGQRLTSSSIIARPTLKRLVLKGHANSGVTLIDLLPSVEDFLSALTSMPLLEEMTLHSVFPQNDPSTPEGRLPSSTTAHLPHLWYLDIKGSVPTSTWLLNGLATSANLRYLYLNSSSSLNRADEQTQLCSDLVLEIAKRLGHFELPGQTFQSLSITKNFRGIGIWGCTSIQSLTSLGNLRYSSCVRRRRNCHIDLTMHGHLETILHKVLESFPLSHARTLSVGPLNCDMDSLWSQASLQMPLLSALGVSVCHAVCLPHLSPPDFTNNKIETLLFPHLHTLMLNYVAFGVYGNKDAEDRHQFLARASTIDFNGKSPLPDFQEAIVRRNGWDGGQQRIRDVTLAGCLLYTPDEVQDLKSAVDVFWDGMYATWKGAA